MSNVFKNGLHPIASSSRCLVCAGLHTHVEWNQRIFWTNTWMFAGAPPKWIDSLPVPLSRECYRARGGFVHGCVMIKLVGSCTYERIVWLTTHSGFIMLAHLWMWPESINHPRPDFVTTPILQAKIIQTRLHYHCKLFVMMFRNNLCYLTSSKLPDFGFTNTCNRVILHSVRLIEKIR